MWRRRLTLRADRRNQKLAERAVLVLNEKLPRKEERHIQRDRDTKTWALMVALSQGVKRQDRDSSGNTVLDSHFQESLIITRQLTLLPQLFQPLVELIQIASVGYKLRRGFSALAVSTGEHHDCVGIRDVGLEGNEGIVNQEAAGAAVKLRNVFRLLSWLRMAVLDYGIAGKDEVFQLAQLSRPFVHPYATEHNDIMVLQIFGTQGAAL